ncbi:MAG: ABC transporter substrate-binding protein [Actinomycetota bacterium]
MKRRIYRAIVLAVVGSLAIAACGGDDGGSSSDSSSEATSAPGDTSAPDDTDAAEGEAWTVNTDDCVDPAAANAPIEGTIKIGSVMPLSGGAAAAAFAPVKGGFEAYIKYANEKKLLGDITLEVAIEDDQYNKDLTPGAVEKLLDAGTNVFAGIIGTANNLAVRDLLNEECYPQLLNLTGSIGWGDAENYPWTTGVLVPYDIETKAYATAIKAEFPDGVDVGVFTVNNEFGQEYVTTIEEIAADFGLNIVDEQTIEATDSAPPTAQVNSIATKQPPVILAVPLGAQCATFLAEIANAKAANPGWEPRIYITATCASSLILALAGPAADGIYTSNNLVDVLDPAIAAQPAVAEYLAFMEAQGLKDIIPTAGAGWHVAEMAVAIIKQALESGELTRASIMNAARNFDQVGTLTRPGIRMKLSGTADQYISESLQIVQYDADTKLFTDIGDVITDYES